MTKKLLVLMFLLGLILAACGPSEEAVGTAIASTKAAWTRVPTQTPYPTQTPFPTQTAYPTLTPYPTFTPVLTQTALPTHTPFPTYTPPVPTETPVKEVLFEEDFSGESSCFATDVFQDRGLISIQDGSFLIDVTVSSAGSFLPVWTLCEEQVFTDFSLEVETSQRGGTDNNGYGLLFKARGNVGYMFMISGDGYYCLEHIDFANLENEWVLLGCWLPLSEVNRGNQENHIRVVTVADQIELYVNGELVGLVRDVSLFRGQIGFVAFAYEDAGTAIAFDNVRVTEP